MAKKAPKEQDEERLKKKVAEREKGIDNPEGDAAFRALKKRLKRAQRRRRSRLARLRHAAGKKAGATEAPKAAIGA
jgi:hypothetical protein